MKPMKRTHCRKVLRDVSECSHREPVLHSNHVVLRSNADVMAKRCFFFLTIKIYTYIFNLINCFKLNKLIFSICSTFLGKKVCVESHVNKLGRFVSRKY